MSPSSPLALIAAIALSIAVLSPRISPADETDLSGSGILSAYLQNEDQSYAWSVRNRYRRNGTEIIELRMQSQTWQGQPWRHLVFAIKPDRIDHDNQALAIIAGGRWREEYESDGNGEPEADDVRLFTYIAKRLRTIVVVVAQIPYQPLFDRSEDELVAYSFDRYRETGDSSWPLLLPMVKGVARGMDAAQDAVAGEWRIELEHFTLVGGSKRGWATWLTAAIDRRVTAFAPAVFDALNMAEHFPFQSEAWGAPSDAIRSYTELDLHSYLSSSAGQPLRDIVDPFSYRSALTQPKLIVIATNDEFFPVDSLNLYWQALDGPKYILYLPNDSHEVHDFRRLISGLYALHRHAAAEDQLPDFNWRYRRRSGGLTLEIASAESIRRARIWTAHSDDRDFRDAQWAPRRLKPRSDSYSVDFPRPSSGYAAMFIEARFGRGRRAFSLSTNLCVLGAEDDAAPVTASGRPNTSCGDSTQ